MRRVTLRRFRYPTFYLLGDNARGQVGKGGGLDLWCRPTSHLLTWSK